MIVLIIRCYQYVISPVMPSSCRFYPSCSHYAQDAIEQWGLMKGLWYTLFRLLRCHPWGKGGYDPVLSKKETH